MRYVKWIALSVIVGIVILNICCLEYADFLTYQELSRHRDVLKNFVNEHPFLAPLTYIITYVGIAALSIPGGALVSIAGGFIFGQPWSTVYVVIGATAGASLLFLAARTLFQEILRPYIEPYLKRMEKGFQENAASYLLFLRFVPLFPFWGVNLAPAFLGVRLWTFIWTTFVGIIPGAFVFTQAGTGLEQILDAEDLSLDTIFNLQVKIALVALALFALAPILIKKIRKTKS